jgi:hypothetical protein
MTKFAHFFHGVADFAHVFPIGEGFGSTDESYRCGLDNLLLLLEGIGKGLPAEDIKVTIPKLDIFGLEHSSLRTLCFDPVSHL